MVGVLVVGPESSGTRLMTRLLIQAGCRGQDEHEQAFDDELPEATEPIVWRRSIPHGHFWPNLLSMITVMQTMKYEPKIVVTTRDWFAMSHSQLEAQHVKSIEEALKRIKMAYRHIFEYLLDMPTIDYIISSYESLVLQEGAFQNITDFLCLRHVPFEELHVFDGNKQYYAGNRN